MLYLKSLNNVKLLIITTSDDIKQYTDTPEIYNGQSIFDTAKH